MPQRPAHKSSGITRKRKVAAKNTPLFNRKSILSLKKILVLSFVGLISIAFLGGISVYRTLTKSMAQAESSSSNDTKNQDIVTLLLVNVDSINSETIKTNAVDFLIFDKTMKKVVTFKIPMQLERDLPGRFGLEKYQNALPLGVLEGKDIKSGINLLRNLVKKDFAFNVDKILVVEKEIAPDIFNTFETGKNGNLLNYDVLSSLVFNSYNDLSPSDLYDFYTFVRGLTSDRFIVHEEGVEYFKLEDFTDKILRDLTFDSYVAEEGKSFALMNGTNIGGVATFGTRLVQNLGGHVIATENTDTSYAKTVLIATEPESASVRNLKRFFNVDKVVSKAEYHGDESLADRADVTLIIGFDIAETL